MKKKGFTLIELLAVIVVLAIIALIATPIVMDTIKRSQKGAAERSADNYIEAVETAVATSRLDSDGVQDGTYTIGSDGNLTGTGLPNGKLTIEMSGNKPTGGTITIRNGQVTTDSKMTIGSYEVTYNPTNKKYEATEKDSKQEPVTKTYNNGEVVYFNVTTGEKCTSSDYTETQSNTGTNSGCMKFYAFNDDGGNTINLILDHNTTATVKWNSSSSNVSNPSDVLIQLKSDTESWKGTETPKNYTNSNYTIDYSTYKARLITANEIATITGNTTWDEKTADNYFYFDSKTSSSSDTCKEGNTTECKYGWLYDRTHTDCTTYGCLNNADSAMTGNGYWTASFRANSSDTAWVVEYRTSVNYIGVYDPSDNGVRPVITVLKSKLI